MQKIELKYMSHSSTRAIASLVALILIGGGVWYLWGFAMFCIVIGAIIWVDIELDEIEERITGITRDKNHGG